MSGFVSAGTNDGPIERDDEWRKAQEVVEANFRQKQEEGKQDGGKSLYEVLQQNKGDLPTIRSRKHSIVQSNMSGMRCYQPPNRKHLRNRFG